MKIRLDVAARAELRRAVVWYEQQRPTLGEDLVAAVKHALIEIERAPERWPTWRHEPRVRRYLLQRFPFAIAYIIRDGGPYVVAIAHTSRTARHWLGRIEGTTKRPVRRRR